MHSEEGMDAKTFEDDRYCFVCGDENPIGLHLRPREDDGVCEIVWTPPREFQGFCGVLHGGILSMLLDEVMAHAARAAVGTAATARISTRFRAPVRTGVEMTVRGRVVQRRKALLFTEAEVLQDGNVKAGAEGLFVAASQREVNGQGCAQCGS